MPKVAEIRPNSVAPRPIELRHLEVDGLAVSEATVAWGASFSPVAGVRKIPHYVGMTHTPGTYWCATGDRHIDYESYLEARWTSLLDFDPHVVEIMTQPLTIVGADHQGQFTHTPDIFVRLKDGHARLIDVKYVAGLDSEDTLRAAQLSAAVAKAVGWDYHLVGEPPPRLSATVGWLSGYRRPQYEDVALRDQILELTDPVIRLRDLWEELPDPVIVRPVVYHLLWHHKLLIDLKRRLNDDAFVWTADQ